MVGQRTNIKRVSSFCTDSGENYAERRKKIIQESKYLGGDMEHTHLVKGLDYALLDKVGLLGFCVAFKHHIATVPACSSGPCRVGSVGSVSAPRTVDRQFASQPGHTKDHHKNGANCLPA